MRLQARKVALAGALAASLSAGEASASPQEVIGFGFRSLAMGNSGAAIGEGVDAVYANPALLSTARQMELQLGTLGASFDLSAAEHNRDASFRNIALSPAAMPSAAVMAASTPLARSVAQTEARAPRFLRRVRKSRQNK